MLSLARAPPTPAERWRGAGKHVITLQGGTRGFRSASLGLQDPKSAPHALSIAGTAANVVRLRSLTSTWGPASALEQTGGAAESPRAATPAPAAASETTMLLSAGPSRANKILFASRSLRRALLTPTGQSRVTLFAALRAL